MADFLELSEVYENKDGYRKTAKIILNKYLIKELIEDVAHSQTFIKYDNDREIRVAETVAEINAIASA